MPFDRLALLRVTELLVTTRWTATIISLSGHIEVDVGNLIGAMRHLGGTPVDPTLQWSHRGNCHKLFASPGEDNLKAVIDWEHFVVQTCTEQAERKRRGKRPRLLDLRTIVNSLIPEFNMTSARERDLLATTLGIVSAPPNSAFQLNTVAATALQIYWGGFNYDEFDGNHIFSTSSTESMVPCLTCQRSISSQSISASASL